MRTALAGLLPTAAGMSWLLSTSLKAALLLAASWLAALLLRRGMAAARHQLWALGVAGALLLPILCWIVPSLARSPSSQPPTAGAAGALQATTVYVTGGRAASAPPDWPGWLALAWAAGGLLLSSRLVRAHVAARRLAREAEPARAAAWLSARREAAAALGMAADVFLGRHETLASPVTIGVWRPRVLLPAAADAWPPERLRAVLIHELGHVRRRDTLIQLGAQLACVLYWWNPLAWLAAARLRTERELACDDLVLGAGIRPSSYAANLLEVVEVARGRSPDAAAYAGAISMVDGACTEGRLRRILDPATPHRPLRAWFRVAARGAAGALAMTLACSSGPPPRAAASRDAGGGPLWLGRPAFESDVPRALLAEDPVDMSLVAKEMERHVGDLEQCYARRLRVHPGLSGTVIVRWTMMGGMVFGRGITEDTLQDAEVLTCVENLFHDARFPASTGGPVEISFPFFFGRPPPPPGEGC